ncbi:phenylalanine ammonium lyase [Mycena maculata]|uniref:Phenylalanine ammonium lyase n=1 Tax=Mycena maculata TaxID=230809 RepID=A0AAD7NPK1_9AGAR|nr:phenylalanine ammonium lyase [Mycena maculata]
MVVNSTGKSQNGPLVNSFNDTRLGVRLSAQLSPEPTTLLSKFLAAQKEIESYRYPLPVHVDGKTLSISAVTAAARHVGVDVQLSNDSTVKARVLKSRVVITDKVEKGTSVYGLSTGFGGSADTRTDKPILLGHALLQHQHAGVLPSSQEAPKILPLLDPGSSTTMPESWVRGAILIRMNSLIRGHSGVRWELIEKINEILCANVVPAVPMRGSISASGDLSPLSYVAGLLVGNPSIRAFDGPAAFGTRKMVSSRVALAAHDIVPIALASKEQLGILNGTAFSASVASLALNDAVHLTLLAQVCTALGTEALLGSRGSFDPFIHSVARPHPGQVECARNIWNLLEGSKLAETHEEELGLEEDKYSLRQDRYPLRTSPQFLGPQIEDILSALTAVTQECNSTTDNPLVDGETGEIHHGMALILLFLAMAISLAMEKTRLSLSHIGKLLFAQTTELLNPAMNRGLPPSLAASDPSLNYFGKGVDIATAAYVSELGYLANPVSTHIQSAEMHNQAVNSLALISARATINSLDVLTMLTSSYLYVLCQALDLRVLQEEFTIGLFDIVRQELTTSFGAPLVQPKFVREVCNVMKATLERTSTMDAVDQMREVASSSSTMLLNFFANPEFASSQGPALVAIPRFQTNVASQGAAFLNKLRGEFLSGQRGASPASSHLGKTRLVYEFIRRRLGIKMHGAENYSSFANGLGVDDVTVGQNISVIYEAIRDGEMQSITATLFQ